VGHLSYVSSVIQVVVVEKKFCFRPIPPQKKEEEKNNKNHVYLEFQAVPSNVFILGRIVRIALNIPCWDKISTFTENLLGGYLQQKNEKNHL